MKSTCKGDNDNEVYFDHKRIVKTVIDLKLIKLEKNKV